MKLSQLFSYKDNGPYNFLICIVVFSIIFIPSLWVSVFLRNYSNVIFHFAVFIAGWVGWTFFEYLVHRYLMHTTRKENTIIDFDHTHHHTHPTDIKISGILLCILFIGCIILLIISISLDNYFTIAAGFLCGFPGYTFMHFFLHQKIAQKVFSKLVKYHTHHHCKYPDRCFGISVTWWDDLFETIPLQPAVIPQRIVDFFYTQEAEKPPIKYN